MRRGVMVAFLMALVAPGAHAGEIRLSQAVPQPLPAMHIIGAALAPAGFEDFCRRDPRDCQTDGRAAERVQLNARLWRELLEVNSLVNATVIPQSDLETYGVVDYWTLAGTRGDCEDYALTKQHMLRERGWPASALLVSVVRDEHGEGHAVLTARTSAGDLILDNRQNAIVAWSELPYTFVKRQATFNPKVWMALEPGLARQPDKEVATARPRD